MKVTTFIDIIDRIQSIFLWIVVPTEIVGFGLIASWLITCRGWLFYAGAATLLFSAIVFVVCMTAVKATEWIDSFGDRKGTK